MTLLCLCVSVGDDGALACPSAFWMLLWEAGSLALLLLPDIINRAAGYQGSRPKRVGWAVKSHTGAANLMLALCGS